MCDVVCDEGGGVNAKCIKYDRSNLKLSATCVCVCVCVCVWHMEVARGEWDAGEKKCDGRVFRVTIQIIQIIQVNNTTS